MKNLSNIKLLTMRKLKNITQVKIKSSIFRNINRDITPKLIKTHFQGQKSENVKKSIGRGKFLKICKDTMYAKYW